MKPKSVPAGERTPRPRLVKARELAERETVDPVRAAPARRNVATPRNALEARAAFDALFADTTH